MRPRIGHEWLRPPQGTDRIPRGTLVRDLDTGYVGILQDVTYCADDDPPRLWAFLRPAGGGAEWTAEPGRIVREPDQEGIGAPGGRAFTPPSKEYPHDHAPENDRRNP